MSKKAQFYCQCLLQKDFVDGTYKTTVTWLPQPHAQVGAYKKLKDKSTGEWEDGWKIVRVGRQRPASTVEAQARDYLNQRSVSDV